MDQLPLEIVVELREHPSYSYLFRRLLNGPYAPIT